VADPAIDETSVAALGFAGTSPDVGDEAITSRGWDGSMGSCGAEVQLTEDGRVIPSAAAA
jgi:hypothetical protein